MTCSRFVVVVLVVLAAVVPAAAEQTQKIERLSVHGTRRIEADAVLGQLGSTVGKVFDPIQLRADLRAVWKLGVFSDVRAFTEPAPAGGVAIVLEVVERPTVRKVLVTGNDEVGLDKIDEVLDLERDRVADLGAIRANRDKIAELLVREGYYLSSVDYDVVAIGKSEVDVRFTIDEHAKIRVADVVFVGNHALTGDALRETMMTRPPGPLAFLRGSGVYRRDMLERDLAVVTARYLDAGYATVKIAEPRLRLSRDKTRMHVTVVIDEGPRFAFGAVAFRGADVNAHPPLGARAGATFSRTQVERDRELLETYYQDAGYAYANVVPRMKLDLPNRRVDVAYEVARGRRVYVERIAIRGNAKTRDKVIRRELKLAEGELFSRSKLEASKRRVTALGFFDSVTIASHRGSADDLIALDVEVHERRAGTMQIGAGFSSVESFIVQGQVSQDNFLGYGQSLAFSAQISRLRRQFAFRFVEPYFLDTRWSSAVELYNQSRGFGAYSRNATGGALTWGHPLSDRARASLTYRLEHVDLSAGSGSFANFGARSTSLSSLGTANLMRGGWMSSVRAALAWDSRDNRLLPTGGTYASLHAEYAGKLTGSENDLVRWGGFVRHYHRLGTSPFVLRLNGELGVTTSIDGKGVPISERYLLGGIYDIRGYQTRSLGPQLFAQTPGDPTRPLDPLPLGGNLELIGNAEIEFPLVKKLGLSGVAFFDIGNAYNLESRFCSRDAASTATEACLGAAGMFSHLRKSVGLGVRWLSPIGPLRFEWGIPLDLRPGEKPTGLEFTIGTSF